MGDYWDTYGTGDAWCDRFGNQVDPRTFPNEDSIQAAGYHHVNQAGARDWIARELGDVPVRPGSDWRNQVWGAPADWHVDSSADDATAWGIVWGRPGVVPVP